MSDDLVDLVDACHAKPDSAALHRALLAALEEAGEHADVDAITGLEVAPRPKPFESY
jgi:hypothetical protein